MATSTSQQDFGLMPSPAVDPSQIPVLRPIHHTPSLLLINRTTDFSTTSYELNNFNPPETPSKSLSSTPRKPPNPPSTFMIKVSILLSRSSGRDKLASLLQYGAMFIADQRLIPVLDKTPYLNLEESMSTGRKTLRLFKWLKEFERMERAFLQVDPGPHESKLRKTVASVIGLFMHTCSFVYYLVDNILYCSQTGLIRAPEILTLDRMRSVLQLHPESNPMANLDDSFVLLQEKFHLARRVEFEDKLKDWKNLSSLFRLLSALVYCSIQIDSANHALGKEKDMKKRQNLEDLKYDSWTEIMGSLCNLGILLNRLKYLGFDRIPMWGVGVLGIGSSLFGLEKNWPVEKMEDF
ncbi:hypothetical protein BASA81_013266 [Batrachochytrium salamandrivorans]|nr:hypothetical protein BASA81_013266 [Batrachochytrium salamandrivorans]